jgi:hypothetical protein
MKTFHITLSAKADVSQSQTIRANSAEEAKRIALERFNDNTWDYMGVDDETVRIESVE